MPDLWLIRLDGPEVEVLHNGRWFAGADDLDDALGIVNGQRAREVTIDDQGYQTRRTLW